ncbi:SGNH/GDSL hydrolase family protein [Halopseudomonas laoshanensis]|uniref:SGNH/GDSL hydrolase family protein n=1 Tax=Halopseudomonas laoshanensis TaxID=2268758 RepID=UPI00319DEC93
MWVKKTALRLPDAALPWQGVCTPSSSDLTSSSLRLLVIGESTVAGVGVDTQQQALCGQLAQQMADAQSRQVIWQACGRNGATAAVCRRELLATLEPERWDLVVIVLGVNDTTHLTPRWRWRSELMRLLDHFNARADQVLVTAVPPLGRFHALPQPLRGWFGLRAGLLDLDAQRCCAMGRALHVPMAGIFERHYLARDGYHPSQAGYALWAADILRCLTQSSCLSPSATASASSSG